MTLFKNLQLFLIFLLLQIRLYITRFWTTHSKKRNLTELFMIQDKSEDFIETKKFLDNRFNDLHNIYKINQQV